MGSTMLLPNGALQSLAQLPPPLQHLVSTEGGDVDRRSSGAAAAARSHHQGLHPRRDRGSKTQGTHGTAAHRARPSPRPCVPGAAEGTHAEVACEPAPALAKPDGGGPAPGGRSPSQRTLHSHAALMVEVGRPFGGGGGGRGGEVPGALPSYCLLPPPCPRRCRSHRQSCVGKMDQVIIIHTKPVVHDARQHVRALDAAPFAPPPGLPPFPCCPTCPSETPPPARPCPFWNAPPGPQLTAMAPSLVLDLIMAPFSAFFQACCMVFSLQPGKKCVVTAAICRRTAGACV